MEILEIKDNIYKFHMLPYKSICNILIILTIRLIVGSRVSTG